MPVNVGTLVIDLVAGTSSFSASMDKMSELSARTANDISRSLNKVALAGAAAIAAISGALTGLVVKALNAGDALDSFAQATGTTVETLSLLQYNAALLGSGTEDLTTSLERLAKAEFEASTGNVQLARVFRMLGVSVTDSNRQLRDTGVVYEELAEKFAAIPDSATKTALAIQFFGKTGANQIPVLNQLGSNLAGITKEAREFGVIMGTSTAHMAADAHAQLDKLKQVVKGLGYSLLTELLPAMKQLLDDLIATAKQADIPGLARTFSPLIVKLITDAGQAMAFATRHATALKIALEALAAVQLSRIAIPVIADLISGGFAKAGDGVLRFITRALGLTKVTPALAKIAEWVGVTTRAVFALVESEGILGVATAALGAVFGTIAGAVAVAVAAIALLVGVLYYFRNSTFSINESTYKLRDTWNAAWIVMKGAVGTAADWIGKRWTSMLDAMKPALKTTIDYFKDLWDDFSSWLGRKSASLVPNWLKDALDQAKAAREKDEAKTGTFGTGKFVGPPTEAAKKKGPPIDSFAVPKEDPYKEAKDKLEEAIAAQLRYNAVIGSTPAAVAAVVSANKAFAEILAINVKLKKEDKALSESEKATLLRLTTTNDAVAALGKFHDAIAEQQKDSILAAAQANVLAEATKHGVDAVRQATVSNELLGATYKSTTADIKAMTPELQKQAELRLKALNTSGITGLTTELANQSKQLAETSRQNLMLADAYRTGGTAIEETKAKIQRLNMEFNRGAGDIKANTEALDEYEARLKSDAVSQKIVQTAQDIKGLEDEATAQRILSAAILGTVDAQREAEAAAAVVAIRRAINETDNARLIANLERIRALILDTTRAKQQDRDTEAAKELRSPDEVYAQRRADLERAAAALQAANNGVLTYGQSQVLAAKQAELFNTAIDNTVQLLLRAGSAGDGVRAFFMDMQKQATSAAKIIYDALHAAFDRLSTELADLVTKGKADFAGMFSDLGNQILKASIGSMLQKVLGGLFGGGKPDGSSEARALYVRPVGVAGLAGGAGGVAGAMGAAGGLLSKASSWLLKLGKGGEEDPVTGLRGALGGIIGKLGGFLGKLTPHAEGGEVSPGSAYLVGERGPELFKSGQSGNVYSAGDTNRMLTGGETPVMHYYNIDARGTDPALTEARTRQAIIAASAYSVRNSVLTTRELQRRSPASSFR